MRIDHDDVPADWAIELGDDATKTFVALSAATQQVLRRGLADIPTAAAESRGGSPPLWRGYVDRWIVDFTRDVVGRHATVVGLREDVEWVEQRRRSRRRLRLLILLAAMTLVPVVAVTLLAVIGRPPGAPPGTQIFPEPNHSHVSGTVTYDRSPPAGGEHWPFWLACGIYASPVRAEEAVHSLEHGSVWLTYRPDLSTQEVDQLRSIVHDNYLGKERYLLLSPYPGQKPAITATAWGAQLEVAQPGDPRLLDFIRHFEAGPQAFERNGYCVTNGTGSPLS